MLKGSKAVPDLQTRLLQIRSLVDDCLAGLDPMPPSGKTRNDPRPLAGPKFDFSQPIRPFIKLHGRNLSGTKKFALLLSRLSKGDPKAEIAVKEIEKEWSRMTAVMGAPYNRFFPTDAKDHDWVESKKKGYYNLRPSWMNIFNGRR
jgi:hypothetical protein